MDADEVLRARDATGLLIPKVCGRDHWGKPLTHPDPKVRAEVELLKQTLRDAKRYGASSVLLVPGVVSKEVAITICMNVRRRKSAKPFRWRMSWASVLPSRTSGTISCSARWSARCVWIEFNSPAVGLAV